MGRDKHAGFWRKWYSKVRTCRVTSQTEGNASKVKFDEAVDQFEDNNVDYCI